MARVAASLTDAYFAEAAWDGRTRRPTSEAEARAFLAAAAAGLRPCERQESAGVELELATPDAAGTALAWAGRLCHAAAFALPGEDMRVYGAE
jgi:hypothetical protein